jgi:hypothetical protein
LDRLTGADKPAPKTAQKAPAKPSGVHRIKLSVFLNQDEDAYLEKLASVAKFSGGKKISKTKLVEAMVRAFGTTGLDVRGVKTEEELYRRIMAQLRK